MKKILSASLLFAPFLLLAQTGPAGVGDMTNNGLWLRADAIVAPNASAVDTWGDASAYGNDAIQTDATRQPVYYNSSTLNGQPVVRFDGKNDQMLIADNPILDGGAGISYFAVLRPLNLNGVARGILGKRVNQTTSTDYAYTWFFWSGNKLNNDINTQNDRYDTGGKTYSNNTNYIVSFDFDGTRPTASRSRMYEGNTLLNQSKENSTTIVNSNQALTLGALNADYGTYLGADYGEIIQFNFALNAAQRIIVNNYLSAKYNVPLTQHDLYTQDNASNGDFDHEVAGIGRVDAANLHTDAQGSAMLRINNPSNLDDNEFMLWGHNNNTPYATNYTDVPTGVDARLARVWRFSEVDDTQTPVEVGAVDLTWDLAGLGPVTASDLRLLVDTDNDGQFSDEAAIAGAVSVSGTLYRFSGVTAIADGRRLTLGTIDTSRTVLPTQLLSFQAQLNAAEQTQLSWEVEEAVTLQNFELQHAKDAISWTTLERIPAQPHATRQWYDYLDNTPVYGSNYYRLRLNDIDGSHTFSDIVTVFRTGEMSFQVYPNPVTNFLHIEGLDEATIQCVDVQGRVLQHWQWRSGELLDLSRLARGQYFLRITHNGQTQVRRIEKQ